MPKWAMLAMLVLVSATQPVTAVRAQEDTGTGSGPAAVSEQAPQAAPVTVQDTQPAASQAGEGVAAEDDVTVLDEADGDAVPNATLPHDLSPLGMFLAADIVVKTVMIGLALASVATWAVFILKTFELAGAKRSMKRAVKRLVAADGLRDADQMFAKHRKGPAADMVAAAKEELVKSDAVLDHVSSDGVKERIASRLSRIEAGAGKRMASGTGILATIGSISPFVGLFGTVWGIMNSFIGISRSQTTNLAIVAPGIAEALLATAIGLVAAIPAVVIYNYFARSISGYRLQLGDAGAAVERLVSRDLDQHAARRAMPRKPEQPHSVQNETQNETMIARIG